MATKIVTKNSSTASAVPTASDLVQGELAVNVADKRLFTEDNGGVIVELGTNPSTLTVTGEITANGGIALGDNDKATFGAGDDLQIYHDGSHSYIKDVGTGNLRVDAASFQIRSDVGENMAGFAKDGPVDLSYNGETKFSTTSTGIDVTGTATMDGLTVSASAATANITSTSGGATLNLTHPTATDGYSIRQGNANADDFRIFEGSKIKLNITTGGDISFYEDTGTTPKLFWDASAESLGIGTSSPAELVHAANTSTGGAVGFRAENSEGHVNLLTNGGGLQIETSATGTVATIDSSGNVLVGTTDAAVGVGNTGTGLSLAHSGYAAFSRTGSSTQSTLFLNKNSNDGSILNFAKNGTTVGSIGTEVADGTTPADLVITAGTTNASRLWLKGGDSGLILDGHTNSVLPTDENSYEDNRTNLGSSSYRFKNLYLSGGVYLGGTGAANKLDDYEEGTWTGSPTAGASSVLTVTDEKYTKIGNQVTIACTINFSGASGVLNVAGLPFNCAPAGVGIAREDSVSGYLVYGRVLAGTTDIDLFSPGTSNASPFLTSAGGFRFTMTYLT